MNPVADKINELIEVELEEHPKQLDSFFERVHSNYAEAIRTASLYFLLMLAAWFLTYAIQAELIKEITFLGFELNPKMIVVSPFLVGLLTYGMLSALAGAVVLWEAISRSCCKMLPTAWKYSLDDLLAPPTFSNVERMLEPQPENRIQSLFSRGWFMLITLLMFAGSLVALVHTTYLFFNHHPGIHWGFGAVSALLGAIAWIRGVVLFRAAIEATGGYSAGQHPVGRAACRG